MRIIHLLKIRFLSIKWYFDLLAYARKHAKDVDNYKFLVGIKKSAEDKYLEMERTDAENPDLSKLKIQIELLDKILNYVKR